jgi:hypothetical protein
VSPILHSNLRNPNRLAIPNCLAGHNLRVAAHAGVVPVAHQSWCEDHTPGQCCTIAVDVAPHVAVWLTQTDQGPRVVVDGPPFSGMELTADEACELSDALHQLQRLAEPPIGDRP